MSSASRAHARSLLVGSRRPAMAAAAFALTLFLLLPAAQSAPDHADERQYVWSAGYYGRLLADRQFGQLGSDSVLDPQWDPMSYWSRTQPMGARFIYAAAMAVTDTKPPAAPYLYQDTAFQGPDTEIPINTRQATRMAAVLCAAFGLALIALRFGWPGLTPLLVLALPGSREDLARAWAEGPLLLGLSLAAVSFGTRWFPIACGVAATFKLTALALWPVVFVLHPMGRSRFRRTAGLIPTAAVWSLLTPPAWFAGGPAYLALMAANRAGEHAIQSELFGGPLGIFLPPRYLLPFEFGACLLIALAIRHAFRRRGGFGAALSLLPHRARPSQLHVGSGA